MLLSVKMGITSLDYLRLLIAIVNTVCYIIAINVSTSFYNILMFTKITVVTASAIPLVCLFILFLSKSKLSNDIKIVGQSTQIAKSAGINVDRVRIKAVAIPTVIAAIGQIVYLQSIGTFDTYSAHDQVGVFSVAALLVGGASISESNIVNAFIGAILFHVMFIVAPVAGKNLFGDAQIGEYFRVFFSYGIIAMALALYAWKTSIKDKGNLKTKQE